ncbi:MAG: FkbM family methyltransferase [Methanobacteriaceae archaeon]|nr:FkbM family methyltransferase [Methanobacteriaceae archaeon]MDP2837444.1 FkbM family methyltransferase [Methanobacteriaceae archaeon]MDP3035613.1 FkbM family methyltransferase [Methanobacteriaceae archaeon]MDP3484272.1 FkbM family methyltransferase [Methanobacteriaceae archaeon]MDP3623636.1 FkbM family methyltransferase [Methanobacteriaceae archaeon]
MIITNIKQKYFWLKKIFESVNNPLGTFLFRIGVVNKFICDFKQFGTVKLTKKDIDSGLFAALVGVQISNSTSENTIKSIVSQKEKDIIDLDSIKILNVGISSFIETFVEESYFINNVFNGESIIDIGGHVGDTALYFANKGYTVYSFEPIPEVFQIATKNLELNKRFADRVKLINKAVTSKKGTIKISFDSINESNVSSAFSSSKNLIEVDTTTLETILNEYEIDPYALKIDCEGCEYEIIGKTDLSMFSEILLEYHSNLTGINAQYLIENLQNQGFEVKKMVGNKDMGLIHFYK